MIEPDRDLKRTKGSSKVFICSGNQPDDIGGKENRFKKIFGFPEKQCARKGRYPVYEAA
jgi:hypothetical protein